MPRHQDNVDVVLTTNPRPNTPMPPPFSGVYQLEISGEDPDATWWERAEANPKTRFFRSSHSSGDVSIQATLSSTRKLTVKLDIAFGTRTELAFDLTETSKFSWESNDGHDVTLELSGTVGTAPLEFVCRDETPDEDLWHVDIKANDVEFGTYSVDYRRQEGQPPSSNVKTFTAHGSLAAGSSEQA